MPAFGFIFDHLPADELRVRPMFGAHAIYIGERIVLMVREKNSYPESNGIWVATSPEHHQSLRKEIPALHDVALLSERARKTAWQMIHTGDENFESDALYLCELIRKGDPRIGKVPKSKRKKAKAGDSIDPVILPP
jgi:hypothetical protein